MSKELRYLLHGNKEKYDDVQTSLYITSQESTLWQKIGLQVLTSRKEAWRLIDSVFIDSITPANFKRLGIEKLLAEQVVNLILKLGPECVDGNILKPSERYELLRYISQFPISRDLWRSLRLHESTHGQLERIELGRMFLENPDFSLDERLQEIIILIRENKEIQQNWIPLWTPREAIAKVLSLSNPHEYSELILDALNRMSFSEKEELKNRLQNTRWLPNELNSQGISPIDILKLPKHLLKHQKKLAELDKSKYPEIFLIKSVRSSEAYEWIGRLFTYWNEETTIQNVLNFPMKWPDFWHDFCIVILDAIQDFDEIPKDLEILLQTESWLEIGEKTIKIPQILEIVPNQLKKYLSELVNLSEGKYIEISQLSQAIKGHENFKFLKKFFSKWRENDVIDFILNQHKPHQHYEIIFDALSSLLCFQPQRSLNATNLQKLKSMAWLADKKGNAVLPDLVLHYPNLEEDIKGLLLIVSCSYITSFQLAKLIHDRQDCWEWLTQELFVTEDKALGRVGKLLKDAPEYQLGEFKEFPLDECLDVFARIDVSFLPAWNFAKKLPKKKFSELLLPNLLCKMDEDKLCRLLQSLSSLNSPPEKTTVEVFNAYLGLAVEYSTFPQILPQLRLLNQRGEWQTPDKLTWGKRDNIDKNYVLDEKQTELINSYLNSLPKTRGIISQKAETTIDETNFNVLQTYFRPWEQHCASEPIGAFLSLLHGGDGRVKQLAHFYLGKRDLGFLRQGLVENQPVASLSFDIHVGQASDRTREVDSILGDSFRAKLANTKNPPNLFVSRLTQGAKQLELLPIQPENFSSTELTELLKSSTKVLLEKVYGINPTSLNVIWEELIKSDQLDIQVAKNHLLKNAQYILRMFGADKKNPVLKKVLEEQEKLEYQREELDLQKRSVENVEKRIKEIISKLSELLESQDPESKQVQVNLLESVRSKIQQHGYSRQSIPFELFQNADDAVVEWAKMSPKQQIEGVRKQFVVIWSERKLVFIHAGRPIGCFQHPDCPQEQHRDKGYDRDLVKMLAFNISDKEEGVTGKFGLGFKSVYLACKRPCILSKSLGFTVEGGLIPSRLTPEKTNNLREELQRYEMPSDATAIELALDEGISPQEIIEEFKDLASILVVFSRAIKTCRFVSGRSSETLTWQSSPFQAIQGIEANKFERNGKTSTLLCLRTEGEAEAALLIGFAEHNGRLISTIGNNIPTFWVTAPTQEKLHLGFTLNASFEITTGRESLVKSSVRNRQLADWIGVALGKVLCSLFRASRENWQAVTEKLGLTTVDEYEFWSFMWQELVVHWQKRDSSDGREIISRILGGEHGMGYLIFSNKALPNGLYGSYRQLINISDVDYRVTGKLAEETCFLQISRWNSFQQYQGSLIARKRWEEAKKLLDEVLGELQISDLRLINILKAEIEGINPVVNSTKAKQLGKLISKEFLRSFSDSQDEELQELQRFLLTVLFKSQTGDPRPSKDLLLASSECSEEKLLAGFAPTSRLLHPEYTDSALDFFYACREQREILTDEIRKWVLQADTLGKKEAVKSYLLDGNHRDKLANELIQYIQGSWLESNPSICQLLNLATQKDRIRQGGAESTPKFLGKTIQSQPQPDPDKLFRDIYRWWQKNHRSEIRQYNKRLYPINIEQLKQKLQERDRSAWLMLFFLGLGHRMGRTKHEQHRNFIQFCRDQRWWETFSAPNPQNCHKEWMKVLNEYMEHQSDHTQWNYCMEKFPSIYRAAYYLEAYIQSFLGINELKEPLALDYITAPGVNSGIQGCGGPDAPMLNLGIGVNFVVRELVRLGILQANEYVIPHCFVPRANVRRILTRLGCGGLDRPFYGHSKVIYDFLCDRFNELNLQDPPTFQNNFDIPFELYSEDSSRAEHLSLNEINIKEDYEFNEEEDS